MTGVDHETLLRAGINSRPDLIEHLNVLLGRKGNHTMSEHAETVRRSLYCSVHRQRDCSPLLNGCSGPDLAHKALGSLSAEHATMVKALERIAAGEVGEGPYKPKSSAQIAREALAAVKGTAT